MSCFFELFIKKILSKILIFNQKFSNQIQTYKKAMKRKRMQMKRIGRITKKRKKDILKNITMNFWI